MDRKLHILVQANSTLMKWYRINLGPPLVLCKVWRSTTKEIFQQLWQVSCQVSIIVDIHEVEDVPAYFAQS